MDPEALQAALSELAVGLGDLQISKYIYGSALTILAWEWCLTVEQERQTFWRRRANLLPVLFYLNRYATIAFTLFNVISFHLPPHLLTDAVREGWLHISLSAQAAAQWFVSSAIVTYRVQALYQSNRVIKIGIVVAWALANVSVLVLTIVSLLPDKVVADLPFGLKACHSNVHLPLIFTPFLPGLVYDMLAFALAVWKLFSHASSTSRALPQSSTNRRVYSVMAFDSALYFVVMWAATLVNVCLQLPFSRDTLRIAWDPMLMALGSTMCGRMVLNLRVEGSRHVSDTAVGSTGWSFKMESMKKTGSTERTATYNDQGQSLPYSGRSNPMPALENEG
ncbi:hypothetical protein EXIGLDRAFT_837862 [Exidia glandulosa HHB12029]|uniref:DUF6533 domain-containing protein n=1 Tax=Exidia glandulosa HHB12029 TaxID=1314781 RepID=A0A165GCU9_EXIGL|nr:hypothetical protein EXIGLDRAFT_837862 [Exidia glandulosa HHB12029]